MKKITWHTSNRPIRVSLDTTITNEMSNELRYRAYGLGELDARGVSLATELMLQNEDRIWIGFFSGTLDKSGQIGDITVDGSRWTIFAEQSHRATTSLWLAR